MARMARLVFAFLFVLTATAVSGIAQSSDPDLRGVGLIDFGRVGGCTGTLIQADLVLTAGHCLLPHIGAPEVAARLTFHPMTSNGTPGEGFRAKFLLVHPVFELPGLPGSSKVSRDIGLMQLEYPVPKGLASPIPTGRLLAAHQKGVCNFISRSRWRSCPATRLHENNGEQRRSGIGVRSENRRVRRAVSGIFRRSASDSGGHYQPLAKQSAADCLCG